ncbi:hypothetical protein GUJ93_ZPchr0012g19081 [Zizania palustris]|uniref:Uncharacterized protein n=1 Tax=Zizania palustris TaxID=103762 RepID=A0A8J6BPE5_ZIZPA|nr:hypothetical protein GUJ93_ZPchr0012g19081 [Zizania palustris]
MVSLVSSLVHRVLGFVGFIDRKFDDEDDGAKRWRPTPTLRRGRAGDSVVGASRSGRESSSARAREATTARWMGRQKRDTTENGASA